MKVVCFSPIETTEKKQSRIAARECKRKVRDPVEWKGSFYITAVSKSTSAWLPYYDVTMANVKCTAEIVLVFNCTSQVSKLSGSSQIT